MEARAAVVEDTIAECDVLVVGGGPAGSTISALLAERGWRVTLLEKERHPRFHIGESLLPLNLPILERLGVLDQVDAIGIKKPGADFNSMLEVNGHHQFHFSFALDKRHPYAYEVKRSEFDHLLLRNSAAKGSQVLEEVRVTKVEFRPGGDPVVHAVDSAGAAREWRCRFLVDASGRSKRDPGAGGIGPGGPGGIMPGSVAIQIIPIRQLLTQPFLLGTQLYTLSRRPLQPLTLGVTHVQHRLHELVGIELTVVKHLRLR